MRILSALSAAALIAAAVSPVAAKKDQARNDQVTTGSGVQIAFSVTERRLITQYFASPEAARSMNAKPLPPGIAKKVARGGALPPGIAKRYLPQDLDGRLPPVQVGTERVVVGTDVLLVQVDTGLVLDIIKNAFGH